MNIAVLNRIVHENWSADAFCDLLYETLGGISDKDFHLLLATRAADHIDQLTTIWLFNVSDFSDVIAPAVLQIEFKDSTLWQHSNGALFYCDSEVSQSLPYSRFVLR
ncbi:hypothetical protein F5B17DRAFT_260298 [Nemania serpens]|nr:hypothetical protein F5B17DRAFT_260298 [Nemania serpens]